MSVDQTTEFEEQAVPFDEEEVYVFPTSFGQRRFWFLDQFEPGSPYYNIPLAIRVKGRFDIEIFKRVIDEIIARHEILRTTFWPENGEPLQIIAPELHIDIPVVDLTHLHGNRQDDEIRRLATVEARTPFDLAKGPLFRVTILKAGPTDHVLLITMHHIISDGWSIGVLIREITALYAAFSQGKPSPLPELPIQYADFAEWQREYLQGEVLEEQLNFWKEQLGSNPPVLELPTDRPRPQIQTNVGSSERMILPKELTDKLYGLARQEGATLFMVLLAGLRVLLGRYAGQSDLTIGTPIANRNRAEIEPLIGLFINTLVLRNRFDDNPSFREMIRRERQMTLAAYDHQDLPFEYLVDALQPSRDMSYPPLFQVMLILQNAPMKGTQVGDLAFEQINVDMGTSTHDLTFSITEGRNGLTIDVEFNTDLFERSTIKRLLRHYRQLFEALTADPDQRVLNVNFLSADEIKQIVEDWNDTYAPREPDVCIHHLFERQAAAQPDALAVVAAGESVTYGILNKKANQLASYLHNLGVRPETVVGIMLDRQPHLLQAVLGVLKSGGAYLPLDPSYPQERLSYMLNDAHVPILITQKEWQELIPAEFQGQILLLDEMQATLEGLPDDNPAFPVHPDNLVYMIYTSGSTGKAKGTMIRHRSLVNAYLAWEKAYELRSKARSHLNMASFSFDVFSGDWTRALCSGGKLVLAPREILLEAGQLYALMRKEKITIAEFVPAVLRNLIAHLEETGEKLDFFRDLIAGSDIWYVSEYKKFLSFTGPQTRLINSFGLTEATIDSTYFESRDLNLSGDRLVPIGRPFENMTVYILDDFLQPVPIGVRGELYVGGLGLARGYSNRPDLTAERFLPDPFAKAPGARMYKTGDMARYLADGNIEFLGRADDQVKLRGFRIELGEIETALSEHPDIQTAAVVLREDTPGDKKLIAYFVPQAGKEPTNKALRQFLADKLPEYMVPSAFVQLDEMPLTPNGKVNRRALPPPDQTLLQKAIEQEYEAPRTPTEEVLAEIYGSLLKVEKVGANHNFFDLGGHSLLATQLVSRIRQSFDIDLPLRHVFEKPTVAGLAMIIDQLKLASQGIEIPPIVPVSRDQELPLSFAQQRLWFLAQLEPDSPFYNLPETYRIIGPLKPDVLEQSLNYVIRRHESLRTTFHSENGSPRQVIHEPFEVRIPLTDLSALPKDEREREVERIVAERAWEPIDIETLPLFKVELLKTGPNEHIIILNMHHIIGDNWSSNVLLSEMAVIYEALARGDEPQLPPLTIQYADFAYWQRSWLKGETLQKEIDFWKEQLAEAPPVLELPTDRPRPAVQTFNGAYKTFYVSPEISAALKHLAKQAGATDFMILLAAFQTLLHRYSGQDDILIGTPIANRNHPEIERLIGFFVNTLVIRGRFDERPTFRQLLKQIRETSLAAYAHQDLPFEKLVDALQPERNLSHAPIFQVMFALQTSGAQTLQAAHSELKLEPVEAHSKTAKFDLTLFMLEEGDRFGGALEFNTDLFDEETIDRMIEHFTNLLQAIVENPDAPVNALNLISEQERRLLLEGWNGKEAAPLLAGTVIDMFEKQVEATPDAVALVAGSEQWTYEELNRRANQLAHYLRRRTVGTDSLVGVAVERSPQMVVALLGILKAGAAYVPLDVHYPAERLKFMIEDSGLHLIITSEQNARRLPPHQCEILKIDADWLAISAQSDDNPLWEIHPRQLAYVIYTSGSTGRPKGTLIHHQGLANYLNWVARAYPLKQGRGSLLHSTLAFDATVTALYSPLISGKTVYLLEDEAEIDALGKALLRHGDFSLLKITPAHLELLSLQIPPEKAAGLTHAFVIGGENLTADQIEFWQNHAPETLLFNEYGPTETVVGCVVFEAHRWRGNGSVPIGRAIPNMRVYILDEQLNPVPIGVPGELYISGPGVARGYLNRPDLTAERFLPDPFSQIPGARMYKTGDLVRYLKNGQMEFMGRIDTQVKIRGYRIELGEIENVLREHPSVGDAVAMVRQDVPGDPRLVAYVVPAQEASLDPQVLRSFLKERLPDYMVPAWFVVLKALPLTPNGKVDRRALPRPDYAQNQQPTDFVAPRTPDEEILAAIWQELLHADRVGVHDNFFELGGHSLLATQLISRIRDAFGVELPLKDLFEAPTVAELVLKIEQARLKSDGIEIPPLRPVPREGELPLSFAQQRLWFLDQLSPNSPFYNIPAAVRIRGAIQVEALEKALQEIIRRHESLRTIFVNRNGKPVQAILSDWQFRLPLIDLQGKKDVQDEVRRLLNEDAMKPFKLDQWPLFRCQLLRLGEREHIFMFTMHHIISDGWSTNVFMREMGVLYEAFVKNLPSPLPELRIQYADYAAWQRSWLKDEVLQKQLDYWKNKIGLNPPVLQLPFDRPRPAVQTFNGDAVQGQLPPELSERLNALARRENVTSFMLLLAAFQTLLHHYANQDEILVGTPIANRTQSATEDLIGFFVNTLVLRSDFNLVHTFEDLLRQVRETTLGAYAHQDLPFEQLVEVLQPERNMSHSPLFQVMFVLQNTPLGGEDMAFPSIRLEVVEAEKRAAKFDLTLVMMESAQGYLFEFEYNTDLFDRSTIERLAGHFKHLLKGLTQNPQQPLKHIDFMSEEEKQRVLYDWNQTRVTLPEPAVIQRLFEEQVRKHPDHTALVYRERAFTFEELNRAANRLASYLRKQGVTAEKAVAISVERSPEMVIGLLAILKAGGVYLPIDPAYPAERIAFILQDSEVDILLTQEHLIPRFETFRVRMLSFEALQEILKDEDDKNPPLINAPENLAYMIYTSGSTGQPKGTMLAHRGLVNLTLEQIKDFDLNPQRRVLQFASFSFDASVSEIFTTLVSGATLILVERNEILDIVNTLNRYRITTVTLPPSVSSLIDPEQVPGLHTLISAGEACTPSLAQKWFQNVRFLNAYGPTENTVCASRYFVKREVKGNSVPIGKPLGNVTLYVLNEALLPRPIGVPGELYIGGIGLARGYLKRPDLTAERFVPNPFATQPGERLYKTGDLVRWLPDGNLEFLGRIDFQVKLRGFRIELGEIESVLSNHPQIEQAAVILREDNPGQKYLAAYCVPRRGASVKSEELKEFAAQYLSDYMVPQAFVLLPALPLTPNGKVDRRALPKPQAQETGQPTFVEAQTELQKRLAAIWSDLLQREKVGIKDNFFDIGGHSLLATQLISRLRTELNIEIPLAEFFSNPTIAGLEQIVIRQKQAPREAQLPPITPTDRSGLLPLSYAQQRLWFLDQLEPESPFYNLPSAVRIKGTLNMSALQEAFQKIIQRHEVLRTVFVTEEGKGWQKVLPQVDFAIGQKDLTHLPEEQRMSEAHKILMEETRKPFRLDQAPLMRVTVLRLGANDFALIMIMHHIISDGWSMNILINELSTLYYAALKGQPVPLPELTVQYGDFAVWQRTHLAGETLQSMLDYWKRKLNNAPRLINLPTDRPRPAVQTFNGKTLSFTFSAELSAQLRQLAARYETTLYMVLLTVFQALLYRKTGQNDLLVGSPIANRNRQEIEPLIGFFVNTLVLRAHVQDTLSFEDLLAQVKETALEAYAHQDVPFEMVVDAVQPERALNHSPLFQVVFTLQNTAQETGGSALPFSDLKFEAFEAETGVAKFDLTLSMIENREQLSGALEFNTDLFDDSTIEAFIAQLEAVARQAVEQPQIPIAEIILHDEKHGIPPVESGLPHGVQAQKDGDRGFSGALLGDGSETLTTETLLHKALNLSRTIRSRCAENTNAPVALYCSTPAAFFTALFAVWQTGQPAVLIDPDSANDTVQEILESSGSALLVCDRTLEIDFPQLSFTYETLPSDVPAAHEHSETDYGPTLFPAKNAQGEWVFTTLNFKTLRAQIHSLSEILQLRQDDVLASVAPYWQTGGLTEALSAWSVSARYLPLHGLSRAQAKERLRQAKSTVAHLPLGWLEKDNSFLPPATRLVIPDGYPALRSVPLHLPADREYGILFRLDETAGYFTGHTTSNPTMEDLLTLGLPLPGHSLGIYDDRGRALARQISGRLSLGGLLAEGYYGHAAETARRFINANGIRTFASDLRARWTSSGKAELTLPDEHVVILNNQPQSLKTFEQRLLSLPTVQEARLHVERQADGFLLHIRIVPGNDSKPKAQHILTLLNPLTAWLDYQIEWQQDSEKHPEKTSRTTRKPKDDTEALLLRIWQSVLQRKDITPEDNFFDLGGDSILTIQVIAQAAKHGLRITPKHFFENPTIAFLAKVARQKEAEEQLLTGPVPLTPIQQSLFEQMGEDKIHHFNTAMMFELGQPLQKDTLMRTVRLLSTIHPNFRLRFEKSNGQWQQLVETELDEMPVYFHDLHTIKGKQRKKAIEEIATKAQQSFNITRAPLFRFDYMDFGPRASHRLLIVIHHLTFDGIAWRTLIPDFIQIYSALNSRQKPRVAPSSTPYTNWAQKLASFADSDAVKRTFEFWQPLTREQFDPVPLDNPAGENTFASSRHYSFSLEKDLSKQYIKVLPAKLNVSVNALFLAVLTRSLQKWSGGKRFLTELYNHGRNAPFEDVDLSHTLGWFTIAYPFVLKAEKDDWIECIRATDRRLKEVPLDGLSYGLLRYACHDETIRAAMAQIPQPMINFNYLGQFDQGLEVDEQAVQQIPFRMARESVGPEQHPQAVRPAQLYLVAIVSGGQLHIRWLYSKNVIKARSVKKLSAIFNDYLKELINLID